MQLFDRINKVVENQEKGNRAALCKKIGVNPSTFIGYLDENGQGKIKFSTLARICEVYPDINRDWLLFGEGSISNDPRELEEDPELTCFADTIHEVLFERLSTTAETFAEIGGISVEELTAIMQRKIQPSAMTLRNWCVRYRVNMNYVIAQIGYPLLTRAQYEQDGPLMHVRKRDKEDEYPKGCGNPSFARKAESIDSDLYDGEPYEHDRHKKPLPEVVESMLCPGITMPLVGLAECGLKGWSTEMQMAATTTVPEFHKDMLAALAIGDSMEPAGIRPGNIVYCDPRLEPRVGEPVYVTRKSGIGDGTATVKIYQGQEDGWLKLYGWLPKKDGELHLVDFCMKEPLEFVESIVPVVMIRKRAE